MARENEFKAEISTGISLPQIKSSKSDDQSSSDSSFSDVSTESGNVSEPELRDISERFENKIKFGTPVAQPKRTNFSFVAENSDEEDILSDIKKQEEVEKLAEQNLKKMQSLEAANLQKRPKEQESIDAVDSALFLNLSDVKKSMQEIEDKYKAFNAEIEKYSNRSKITPAEEIKESIRLMSEKKQARKLKTLKASNDDIFGKTSTSENAIVKHTTSKKFSDPNVNRKFRNKKMFGLDVMSILDSEEMEDLNTKYNIRGSSPGSEDELSESDLGKLSLSFQSNQNVVSKKKTSAKDDTTLDDAYMDLLSSDHMFLKKFKARGDKMAMNLNGIKSQLNSLHQKIDSEKRKAQSFKTKRALYNLKPRTKHTRFNLLTNSANRNSNDLLSLHGGTGDWTQNEHKSFIQAYAKHKNNDELLIEQLLTSVPNKTQEDIKSHLKWYKEFEGQGKKFTRENKKAELEKKRIMSLAGSPELGSHRHELLRLKEGEDRETRQKKLYNFKESNLKTQISPKKGTKPESFDLNKIFDEVSAISTLTKEFGDEMNNIPLHTSDTSPFSEINSAVANHEKNAKGSKLNEFQKLKGADLWARGFKSRTDRRVIIEESKKRMREFRARDSKIVAARQKAIMKIQSNKGRYFKTDETRNKSRFNHVKSDPLRPTKGWQYKINSSHADRVIQKERDKNAERCPSLNIEIDEGHQKSFQPTIQDVPALAIPSWKDDPFQELD